jgi:hypothetical protein
MLGASSRARSVRAAKAFFVHDLTHMATGTLGGCGLRRMLRHLGGTVIHLSSCLQVDAVVNGCGLTPGG